MRFALWVLGIEILSLAWGPEGEDSDDDSVDDESDGDDTARLPPLEIGGPCADCESPRVMECLWCRRPYCRIHARDHHCPEMESEAEFVE